MLLFDEIEKAQPDVMNILLQILDDGRITDAQGRTVNFENIIIVMTTNAGSSVGSTSLGFGKNEQALSDEKTMKALKDFLRPEFIGRVDEVVCFHPLTREDFARIAVLMLTELKGSLADKGYTLTWDENVPGLLADAAFGKTRGARDLRNVVRRRAEDPIAQAIIQNAERAVSGFCLTENGLQIL